MEYQARYYKKNINDKKMALKALKDFILVLISNEFCITDM